MTKEPFQSCPRVIHKSICGKRAISAIAMAARIPHRQRIFRLSDARLLEALGAFSELISVRGPTFVSDEVLSPFRFALASAGCPKSSRDRLLFISSTTLSLFLGAVCSLPHHGRGGRMITLKIHDCIAGG